MFCSSHSATSAYQRFTNKWDQLWLSASISYILNSVSKRKWQNKWLVYHHFWPFFCLLYVYLSRNWSSDGHFDVLNWSKPSLIQRLWHKCKYFHFKTWLTHKIMATDKCLFYDHFLSFFYQLYVQLSQNWGSDVHFGILNESKS